MPTVNQASNLGLINKIYLVLDLKRVNARIYKLLSNCMHETGVQVLK